ncbi:hypothetical protein OG613_22660 [Streptomyces sp. NBC_00015]|uniref:hypothetical protein n=1 Tax=unclassified Streptomyces TaxID=2593676 RepID=UPI002251EA72|nr:hypothetical protein [Streptomyces sp. NBC_00103]MCX5369466.1 hypothetical protein [Streptomyces sp. NBC_00103]
METFATLVVVMAMIALGVLLVRLANRQHAIAPPPSTKAAPGRPGGDAAPGRE